MNLRGHFMSQKRTLKTWGRRGRGQIKNACAQDQKGEEWGAAQQPSSEGRERRRRRAEDVGVVLGEAARVRDVGLLDDAERRRCNCNFRIPAAVSRPVSRVPSRCDKGALRGEFWARELTFVVSSSCFCRPETAVELTTVRY